MTAAEKRLLTLTLLALLGVLSTSAVLRAFPLHGPVVVLPFFFAMAFVGFAFALVQALWERRK